MNRAAGLLVALALGANGCDGDDAGSLSPDELVRELAALPGVTVEEQPTSQTGAHYYVLHFTQPVDHGDPSQGTFQQEVSLLHRDTAAAVPMIVFTTGYSDYLLGNPAELTRLLAGNQVSIEHRYFGASRPAPADWTKLTIAQAAADEHDVITALRKIYHGAFLTTGGSKGGMTAVYHRRFYPGDVDGTVAYVAPLSFGVPDVRYDDFLDTLGPADCRQAVRDIATEMLANHRDALVARAQAQATSRQPNDLYTRTSLGAAVESSIVSLEWAFWQYTGVQGCAGVPARSADDDTLFAFLDRIEPVSDSDDANVEFFEAYVYQAYAQLGYPDDGTDYLTPYLQYSDADYLGQLPTAVPAYDADAMRDIDSFVEHDGDRLVFIYGEWDPWTGGKFSLGDAVDSGLFVQAEGTHGSKITGLAAADRATVFAKLNAWTGVAPQVPVARAGATSSRAGIDPALRVAGLRSLRAGLRAR